ncbi:UNVERIFIED_CONTAM: hypothetical protein FKN15_067625 [Acipenser sinensis]
MEGWRDGCRDLDDLLGGLEDQGWCLACEVYGHTVVICPFQSEEEEPAQQRSRKRRGEGKLQQQQQQLQQQQEEVWEVFLKNLAVELCPGCEAYGHTLAICPMQYEEEELAPRRGDHERPAPRRGTANVQHPDRGTAGIQSPRGSCSHLHQQRKTACCPHLQQQRKSA